MSWSWSSFSRIDWILERIIDLRHRRVLRADDRLRRRRNGDFPPMAARHETRSPERDDAGMLRRNEHRIAQSRADDVLIIGMHDSDSGIAIAADDIAVLDAAIVRIC